MAADDDDSRVGNLLKEVPILSNIWQQNKPVCAGNGPEGVIAASVLT